MAAFFSGGSGFIHHFFILREPRCELGFVARVVWGSWGSTLRALQSDANSLVLGPAPPCAGPAWCWVLLAGVLSLFTWHESTMGASALPPLNHSQKVKLLIDGEFVDSKATEFVDVVNPVRCRERACMVPPSCCAHVPLLVTPAATLTPACTTMSQANQQVLSKLPLTTEKEFNAAVQAAKAAFPK